MLVFLCMVRTSFDVFTLICVFFSVYVCVCVCVCVGRTPAGQIKKTLHCILHGRERGICGGRAGKEEGVGEETEGRKGRRERETEGERVEVWNDR